MFICKNVYKNEFKLEMFVSVSGVTVSGVLGGTITLSP